MPVYREHQPDPALARYIECVWTLDSPAAINNHRVPPDGCLDIVYDRAHGLRAIGTMTTAQHFHFPRGAQLTGIRFRPGMARMFLGVPSAELTDASLPLEDLWSARARELQRRLDDANSIQCASSILIDNLPAPDHAPNPPQQAIEALAAAHGNADLDLIAHHANLSPRQFRRRCLEETGLTPKRLARVLRFRHACRIPIARTGPRSRSKPNTSTRPTSSAISISSPARLRWPFFPIPEPAAPLNIEP